LLSHGDTSSNATDCSKALPSPVNSSGARIVAQEAHLMTEERIALGSRPFYGFALPLF
jgi:hypothetical protein